MANIVPSRVPSSLSRLDRQTTREVALIHAETYTRRARDVAKRDLAIGRVHDIATLTHVALGEGSGIAHALKAEIDSVPYAAGALAHIAEDGIAAIRREVRGFGLED